jgi:hypothetical protein
MTNHQINNKKSFILHSDSLSILDEMTIEQAGIFIKAIYHYQINNELPVLDFGMKMAINPFINQFKRDIEKWDKAANRNKINGLKGGRPKTQENPNNPVGFSETQENPTEPKKAVNVSVNVNGNVSVNDKVNKKIKLSSDNLILQLSKFCYNFTDIEKELIKQFCDFRIQLKKPFTEIGFNQFINSLTEFSTKGFNISEIMKKSMANGWQGIFEPKSFNKAVNLLHKSNEQTYSLDEEF